MTTMSVQWSMWAMALQSLMFKFNLEISVLDARILSFYWPLSSEGNKANSEASKERESAKVRQLENSFVERSTWTVTSNCVIELIELFKLSKRTYEITQRMSQTYEITKRMKRMNFIRTSYYEGTTKRSYKLNLKLNRLAIWVGWKWDAKMSVKSSKIKLKQLFVRWSGEIWKKAFSSCSSDLKSSELLLNFFWKQRKGTRLQKSIRWA